MCLAALAIGLQARFPWVVAANRDEAYDRPALPLAWWQPDGFAAPILGGRDLAAGGTWLGVDRRGRLALLTNVREPGRFDAGLPSRGDLVLQALATADQGPAALDSITRVPRNGFNLLRADLHGDGGWCASNRQPAPVAFGAGVHGLSNAAFDTPWPKVVALKARLAAAVQAATDIDALADAAFAALADPSVAPDEALPSTGVPQVRERQLSPAFIHIDGAYGTRCSTVVVVTRAADGARTVQVMERRFDASARPAGDSVERLVLPPG